MADEQTEFTMTESGPGSSEQQTAPKKRTVAKKAAKKAPAKKAAAKKTAKKAPAKKTATKKTAKAEEPAAGEVLKKPALARPSEQTAGEKPQETPPPARQPESNRSDSDGPRKAARKILAVPEELKNNKPSPPEEKKPEESDRPQIRVTEESGSFNDSGQDRPMGRVPGGGRVQQNEGRNKNRKRKRKKNGRNREFGEEGEGNRNSGQSDDNQERPGKFSGEPYSVVGILESTPKGFGFLREPDRDYEQSKNDVFVSPDLIQNSSLRPGQLIKGKCQQGSRGPQLIEIESINGYTIEEARSFPHFEELKAVNPNKRIAFETTPDRYTTRVLDIIAPVGRGQRGLIVSPPRAGKTTLLLHIAEAVKELHDETIHLMICLVDERPEEVTEFRRQVPEAEIYASSNDEPARNHTRLAELCIERAKRLVEAGQHVFILMDSITRLARAYNNIMGGSKNSRGRGIQSGGIMAGALEMPRRLFAAARNTREAGSLTILGTALVHTNSKADDAIFQEFKGTGNMELVLDRRIAEHFVYPAVDLFKSGTRREELILPEHNLYKINLIRRGLAGHRQVEAMERLLFFLKKFPSNAQMLMEIKG